MSKTILITGSSSGIGRAVAMYFQLRGWNVSATMRQPDKENELEKLDGVRLFPLDVLDENSIHKAIEGTIQHFGSIDVIVNNAGYGLVGPFEASTHDQVKKQFDTNVFGVMNVCRGILPYFRAKKAGTIINIASVGGRITFPLYSLYHGTKWAVEGFSESLHYEIKPFGIKVRIIEPGAIKTDFYQRSMDVVHRDELTAYDQYVDKTFNNIQDIGNTAAGPEVVAKKIFKAATDRGWRLRYAVGGGAPALLFMRRILPNSWFFAAVRMVAEKARK
ncbi:SDR family oxidoreductase [Fulvivirga sp. M361]|uniref:SDR family oxidoreductase n=1 Tax=Fulvivirga sp. M361 TaxID=2594266 RepID=UPI00117B196C|nr:SDR family oxidoreductase [Fulvivirga sp. M361]TRX56188.1 SDR family oxidoreductase [Fulvivirga sp. M361]